MAYYYIINGIVRQAPDFSTLVNSRLHTLIAGLNKTIQTLAPCARYHPSDGSYSWEDPNIKTDKENASSEVPKRSEDNVATNPYQVYRMDFLLNEWANRFPMPPLSGGVIGGSAQPTPQQTPHPTQSSQPVRKLGN